MKKCLMLQKKKSKTKRRQIREVKGKHKLDKSKKQKTVSKLPQLGKQSEEEQTRGSKQMTQGTED